MYTSDQSTPRSSLRSICSWFVGVIKRSSCIYVWVSILASHRRGAKESNTSLSLGGGSHLRNTAGVNAL